jgi:hypothetical protein
MALRRDQLKQALESFQMASELQPKESEYQALVAWTKFAMAEDKAAIAVATRKALVIASEANDRSPTAKFYLGRVERIGGPIGREALEVDTVGHDVDAVVLEAGAQVHVAHIGAGDPDLVDVLGERLNPLGGDGAELPRLDDGQAPERGGRRSAATGGAPRRRRMRQRRVEGCAPRSRRWTRSGAR